MRAPIYEFVQKYSNSGTNRLHMPGHKGVSQLGFESLDITEINGADVLYLPNGIIKESQDNASKLFGAEKTLYSVEGSSLSIRAICYLLRCYAENLGVKPLVFATRNAHKSFSFASANCELTVKWLYSGKTLASCPITAKKVASAIDKAKVKPIAVYLTSPDYLGNIIDIKSISSVCKERGVLLVVDNAHGAYLAFCKNNLHPINLGADICCDSAHKTLPALTGCGYLHLSKDAPKFLVENAQRAMSNFSSTSPSYLLMQSLDMLNLYLSNGYTERLDETIKQVKKFKNSLIRSGYKLCGVEPLKVCIYAKPYGYTGEQLAQILRENGYECEFADPDYMVLMFTPENVDCIKNLNTLLKNITKKPTITTNCPKISKGKKVISPTKAIYMPTELVSVDNALGRILGESAVGFPPCVPIATLGEEVTKQVIECCKYYSIENLRVIKK